MILCSLSETVFCYEMNFLLFWGVVILYTLDGLC